MTERLIGGWSLKLAALALTARLGNLPVNRKKKFEVPPSSLYCIFYILNMVSF